MRADRLPEIHMTNGRYRCGFPKGMVKGGGERRTSGPARFWLILRGLNPFNPIDCADLWPGPVGNSPSNSRTDYVFEDRCKIYVSLNRIDFC